MFRTVQRPVFFLSSDVVQNSLQYKFNVNIFSTNIQLKFTKMFFNSIWDHDGISAGSAVQLALRSKWQKYQNPLFQFIPFEL